MRFRSLFQPVRRPFRWPEKRNVRYRPLHCERLDDRIVPSFLEPVNYDVRTFPDHVVTGDFNNDGRADLLTANQYDESGSGFASVSVLLGNSNGTFQPARHSQTLGRSVSVATGDFNADGKLDLVSAAYWGASVEVLLGQGDGTFQHHAWYYVSGTPQSVSVGDINNDGKLDICNVSNLFGYYGDTYAYVDVLLGTGTGAFGMAGTSFLGYGFHTSLAIADFNGDNKLDIAGTDGTYGLVNVALGTGTAYFNSPTSYQASSVYYDYGISVIATDLNKDGRIDLATTAPSASSVSVLLGNGAGSFAPKQTYSSGIGSRTLAKADFNSDGNPDLIAASTGTVSVMLGTGTGAFGAPIYSISTVTPLSVVVGDFNSDGRPDAATANSGVRSASVFLNDGDWTGPGAAGISISDVTLTEGNSGTTNATFTVSLSTTAAQTITVQYSTLDVSATAGSDYQSTSGTLTFAPGEKRKTVTVAVIGDRVAEWNESYRLVLSNPTNAFLLNQFGSCTITDNEPRLAIDYGPVYITEGNTGSTLATFTVRIPQAYDVPVEVNYSVAEGDTEWWEWGYYYAPPPATAGSDFTGGNGTITIPAGELEKTITVPVLGDRIGEWYEYFSVDLTGSNYGMIDQNHAVGIIVDDEPYLYVNYPEVTEGNSGTVNLIFTIALSSASDIPVTVNYATSDGSAVAGADYQSRSGSVTFMPGESSKTVAVPVIGDRVGEWNESFLLNLTDAVGANLNGAQGYASIVDNEPRINIEYAQIVEGNSGTRLMTFTVYLSAAYDQTVTVRYRTEDGSARVSDNDYNAASGTLTFNPGETSKTFTVTIRGDKKKESDEYFYAILHTNSSNSLIEYDSAAGIIINDDGPRGRRN
jgi:hypothetical protein